MFGIKRFHLYVAGHPFQVHTDHKPLNWVNWEGPRHQTHEIAKDATLGTHIMEIPVQTDVYSGAENVVGDALRRLSTVGHSVTKPNPYEGVHFLQSLSSPFMLIRHERQCFLCY